MHARVFLVRCDDALERQDRSERLGERDLLRRVQPLVQPEQHMVLDQQPVQRGTHLAGQRLAQVDPADLGTDHGCRPGDRQPGNRLLHGPAPPDRVRHDRRPDRTTDRQR
jgi:hypothetical protein